VTGEAPQSPDERLARRIVDRLVRKGLLSEEQGNELRPRLAAGNLRQEDWRLAVEMSVKGPEDDGS